jgi:alpha-mannosidase
MFIKFRKLHFMKTKLSILILLFIFLNIQLTIQAQQVASLSELATISENGFEGFGKNIGKHEFTYGSFRADVTASIIARCKNGENSIEWETAVVPENIQQKEIGFLLIAAIDLTTEEQVFDVYFNNKKCFEIPTSTQKNWQLKNNGSKLQFFTVETDGNGDAFGYMWLTVPAEQIKKGSAQTIKIEGHPNQSNTWIIIYQATDALSFLQNSVNFDVEMKLTVKENGRKLNVNIAAPAQFTGKTLNYISAGKKGSVQLKKENETAVGTFALSGSAIDKKFEMSDSKSKLFIVKSLDEEFESTELLASSVLTNQSKKAGKTVTITAQRKYAQTTVNKLRQLSESVLSRGKIYLMNSSHQDIAWMDSPEKCILERDTMLLSPLFELAQKDKNYRFDVEDALMIKEFIERHPDKKELVKEMLKSGRISCGSTFTQPYEEMYSGEALARQFYFGAKWLKDEFDYNATVYWNEDVPGRTLQMMQIMRKAGTKYLMISRHERGLCNWYSPDGSYVTVFSPGHYGNAFDALQKKFYAAAQFLATSSLDWESYYTEKSKLPVIPLLSDRDMSPAIDYSQMIKQWQNIDEPQNEEGETIPVKLPDFVVASAPEFFDALMGENPKLKAIKGERPAVWLYIHGPGHQKALKASRAADILLTQAEKFATANALANNSFKNYPEQKLQKAWEAKIYPDHGWGGKHGDITDALFQLKFEFTKSEAEEILNKNLNELASKIETQKGQGRPLIVFNSLNSKRDDPVSVAVNFDKPGVFSVELTDRNGNLAETQLTNISKFSDGSIKNATLHFIAKQVPAIGYKTWYLTTSSEKVKKDIPEFQNEFENRFYSIKFGNGGLTSIFDKELNRELIDAEKFKAGEVFTMQSEGNGAGEFVDIQKPTMNGFDKTGNYKTAWKVEESGAVFTSIKFRQKINNAVVEQCVKIYNNQKRIDFETALLNWEGILYREYRMALPLNMTDGQVTYEVPFGVVEVGKDEMDGAAGERYTVECKTMHPRGIENWIGANNNDFGVTMSSTVAVADWIDPTDNPVKNPVLQPVLLASRRSCHWEGNEYLQTGDHHFLFSITSHKQGWQKGAKQARGANETLKAVWADNRFEGASLPESLSFFNTGDTEIFISTIKKAEESNAVVVRLTNMNSTDKKVTLKSFVPVKTATLTSLTEEEIKPISTNKEGVQIDLGHHAIETIKLK